jgi:hypothetical protein
VAVLVLARIRATSERTGNRNIEKIGGKMKINNSAELSELVGQAVLILANRGFIIIPEELSFSDFESGNREVASDLWASHEVGTLDLSVPEDGKMILDSILESVLKMRAIQPDPELPTDEDLRDYLGV